MIRPNPQARRLALRLGGERAIPHPGGKSRREGKGPTILSGFSWSAQVPLFKRLAEPIYIIHVASFHIQSESLSSPMKFAFLIHPLSSETASLKEMDKGGLLRGSWGLNVLDFCSHL